MLEKRFQESNGDWIFIYPVFLFLQTPKNSSKYRRENYSESSYDQICENTAREELKFIISV